MIKVILLTISAFLSLGSSPTKASGSLDVCSFKCYLETICKSRVLNCQENSPKEADLLLCRKRKNVYIIGTSSRAESNSLIADYLHEDFLEYMGKKGATSVILFCHLRALTAASLAKASSYDTALFVNMAYTKRLDIAAGVAGQLSTFGFYNQNYIAINSTPEALNYLPNLARCEKSSSVCYCKYTFVRRASKTEPFSLLELFNKFTCDSIFQNERKCLQNSKNILKGDIKCPNCCTLNVTRIQAEEAKQIIANDYCSNLNRGLNVVCLNSTFYVLILFCISLFVSMV